MVSIGLKQADTPSSRWPKQAPPRHLLVDSEDDGIARRVNLALTHEDGQTKVPALHWRCWGWRRRESALG